MTCRKLETMSKPGSGTRFGISPFNYSQLVPAGVGVDGRDSVSNEILLSGCCWALNCCHGSNIKIGNRAGVLWRPGLDRAGIGGIAVTRCSAGEAVAAFCGADGRRLGAQHSFGLSGLGCHQGRLPIFLQRADLRGANSIAKPELLYPESKVFKSTRPSGSGDLTQLSIGHSDSGFALGF